MTAMDWNDLASRPLSGLGGAPPNTRSQLEESLPFGGNQNLMGDLPRWMNQNLNTQTTGSQTSHQVPEINRFESMEARLIRHEQSIMDRILRETTEQAISSADAMVDAQLQSAWEKERERWRQELVGSSMRRHPNRQGTLMESSNSAEMRLSVVTNDSNSEPYGRVSQLLALPTSWQPRPADGKLPPAQCPLDIESALAHLQIFQRMEKQEKAVNEFSILLTPQPNAAISPVDSGYRFAWQLTRDLLRHRRSLPLSIVGQATAALENLCLNFQTMVANRIRTSGSSAHQSFRNNIANQCVAFCKLVLVGDQQSVWSAIFYCLRCGDAAAALEIYQSIPEPRAAVLQLLLSLAGTQGSLPTVWSPSDSSTSRSVVTPSPADRRSVADLWESCQHRAGHSDLHEQGVYALLSGVSLLPTSDDSNVPGFSTIEDYLMGAIWKALSQQNPAQELEMLAATIRDFGPDYFGSPNTGGWDFARPLLLTGQYERAFSHLVETGGASGLLQATHLAYVLFTSQAVAKESLSESLTTSMLVAYAQKLTGVLSLGAKASLEYVARIPDRRQSRQEVSKLISSTGRVFDLVGSLNAEGTRVRGQSVIDMYFSESEISILLAEAAEMMLRGIFQQGTPKTDTTGLAAMCLMLAGRYRDVVGLLNRMICPPERPDENRSFWLQQVNEFQATYLDKKTEALVALERDGMEQLETNRSLVKLNKFFVAHRQGQCDEAWNIIEGLNFLPNSQADLGSKERVYQSLDPLAKQSFPAILVASMEMLHGDYRRLKMGIQPNTEGIVRDRLGQIHARSSLIATLAGLIGISPDEMEKIARLGSLMI